MVGPKEITILAGNSIYDLNPFQHHFSALPTRQVSILTPAHNLLTDEKVKILMSIRS